MNQLPMTARQQAAQDTRARILKAAVGIFTTRTYAESSLRDIAAVAGINVALVSRHFGSKDRLFEECLSLTIHAERLCVDHGPSFGADLAKRLLDDDDDETNPFPMLVLASADASARGKVIELLEAQLFKPLAERIGDDDAVGRAERILAVCAGVFTWRTLLPRHNFEGPLTPRARLWFEAALQSAFDS